MPRKIVDGSSNVTWIGEKIENVDGVDYYYRGCYFNQFKLSIGDYVHVSNPDQPLNAKYYDVLKITHLYHNLNASSLDFKYQALVEVYRRSSSLPSELTNLGLDLDLKREVVLDTVIFACSIPLTSIRGTCRVMFCEPSKTVPEALASIRNIQDVYICRYKIVKINGKRSLVPVSTDDRRTTPIQRIVSPIKIVNKNSVQKVSKLKQHELENMFAESDSDGETPPKVFKSLDSHNNSAGARRNLNSSLNDAADNVLMGSIVDTPHRKKNDLKVTIKVTRKEKLPDTPDKVNSNTPLKAIQYNNNELNNLPKRQSAVNPKKRADSPVHDTPTKTPKTNRKQLETPSQFGTPNQENLKSVTGTPKSILKPFSIRLQQLSSTKLNRSISFDLKGKSYPEDCITPSKQKISTTTPSPTTPSVRRSKRYSAIYRTNLEESPLDISLGDSPKSLETTEKQSLRTPSRTPRKSASKTTTQTPSKTPKKTPKKTTSRTVDTSLDLNIEDCYDSPISMDETLDTPPKKSRKTPKKTPSKTPSRTPKKTPSSRISAIEAVIIERKNPIRKDCSDVQLAKESLHVSSVPKTLPCREKEFKDVYNFIESKILDESGGCMYVSGTPGTGKTATITEVIRTLQLQAKRKKLPQFEYVEINGMRLTEPRQAYVQIYNQLTGGKVSWEQAHSLLEKRFKTPTINRKTTVLLVDELDILCNRRQDVIYNLLDWPTKKAAQLVVITIANTMDLPERLLMGRVTSRLGLTRLTFQPYSYKQLQEVVQARLTGTDIFDKDAVQLVARKVASISGDCRRALDICRRATEIGEADCDGKKVMVSMSHVQKAFNEMITNPKVIAIKGCSKYEKFFLEAVAAEVTRTGVDETVLYQVYEQFKSICALNGVIALEPGIALRISSRLGSSRLLICEHSSASIHQKIMLNVSQDDIYYALHVNNDE